MGTRNPVFDRSDGDVQATVSCLAEAGLFASELDVIIRKPGNASRAIEALKREFGFDEVNKFAIDLNEQLYRFAKALPTLRKIGFTFMGKLDTQIIEDLCLSVPAWPKGKRCFRFIQIREREGDEGVQRTFDQHEKMIKQTFAPKWWRWGGIKTDKKHLRLLAGNSTHKPCFGWVCADMDANRQRDSITDVRGGDSLADELLAFSWQFPEYCKAIDYKENPGLCAAGYELSFDGCEDWSRVPVVDPGLDLGGVVLGADSRSSGGSAYAVPSRLRE